MDLHQIKAALRALPPDQLREVLDEFAPGDGTETDLGAIQHSLTADRLEFLLQMEAIREHGDNAAFSVEAAEELVSPGARATLERLAEQGKIARDGHGYRAQYELGYWE